MSDLKIVLVPRELYYHEVAYVRGLEELLAETHAMLSDEVLDRGGFWHGNESFIFLIERIENILKRDLEKDHAPRSADD